MESLPPELLEIIILHCDHATQKALRSVNQALHELATPFVFSTFHITPCTFIDSQDCLVQLLYSVKNLARHVTHMEMQTDFLPNMDRHEFEAKARLYTQDGVARQRAWQAYRSLKLCQHEWYHNNGLHAQVFKEAVSSLPNLRSASASHAVPFKGATVKWPVWKRLKRTILISPDDWMYDRTATAIADEEDDDEDEPQYHLPSAREMAHSTLATLNLLEAIGYRSTFAGTRQLHELKVHITTNGRLIHTLAGGQKDDASDRTFSPNTSSRFELVLSAFYHVSTLDLSIEHPTLEGHMSDTPFGFDRLHAVCGAEAGNILLRAPSLRKLRFAYNSEEPYIPGSDEDAQDPFHRLFAPAIKTSPWPKLQHLNLSVGVSHTLLLSLLGLLAPALRELRLQDMHISELDTFFANLPAVSELESIYLECVWTSYTSIHSTGSKCFFMQGSDVDLPFERGIKAYLLRQVKDFQRLDLEDVAS